MTVSVTFIATVVAALPEIACVTFACVRDCLFDWRLVAALSVTVIVAVVAALSGTAYVTFCCGCDCLCDVWLCLRMLV